MKALGVVFGAAIALLVFGISLAMVWQYGLSRSDTNLASNTMAAVGVLAIFYSMGGIAFSRSLRKSDRKEIANLILAGVVVAEGVIVFCELGFHGINIKSTELKRAAQSIEVGVNQDQIENARRVIKELSGVDSSGEIEATIKLELAKSYADQWNDKRPLSILANGCNDEKNQYIAKCDKVLKLRADLARAKKFEAAQAQVSTTTSEKLTGKASVNAGSEVGSEMTGFSTEGLSHVQLWFILGLMMVGRLTTVPVIALFFTADEREQAAPVKTETRVILASVPSIREAENLAVDVNSEPRQIEAKPSRAIGKRKKPSQAIDRIKAKEAHSAISFADIVGAAHDRFEPGDYEHAQILDKIRTVASDLKYGRRIGDKTPITNILKSLGAEKLPRDGAGDRRTRYRLHGGMMESAA